MITTINEYKLNEAKVENDTLSLLIQDYNTVVFNDKVRNILPSNLLNISKQKIDATIIDKIKYKFSEINLTFSDNEIFSLIKNQIGNIEEIILNKELLTSLADNLDLIVEMLDVLKDTKYLQIGNRYNDGIKIEVYNLKHNTRMALGNLNLGKQSNNFIYVEYNDDNNDATIYIKNK